MNCGNPSCSGQNILTLPFCSNGVCSTNTQTCQFGCNSTTNACNSDPCGNLDCDDENDCTIDNCNIENGNAICNYENKDDSEFCADGQGTCDGNGSCVECLVDSDCDSNEACIEFSCIIQGCGDGVIDPSNGEMCDFDPDTGEAIFPENADECSDFDGFNDNGNLGCFAIGDEKECLIDTNQCLGGNGAGECEN